MRRRRNEIFIQVTEYGIHTGAAMRVLVNARYLNSGNFTGIESTVLNMVRAFHGDQGLPVKDDSGSREWAGDIRLILAGAPSVYAGLCQCRDLDLFSSGGALRFPGRTAAKILYDLQGVMAGAGSIRAQAFFGPSFTAPLFSGIPRVVMVHDLSFLTHPWCYDRKTLLFQRYVMVPSIRRAQGIVAISRATADQVALLLGISESRIHVAYPPVECGVSLPVSVADSSGEEMRIICAGTIQPRKNQARLIKAFSLLPEGLKRGCRLIIAGGRGWLCHDFDRALREIDEQTRSRITITGYLDRADLNKLLASATILAYPSLTEGFGIPPLEAMCHGVPALVGECEATREVCGDSVLMVDPLSPLSIARGLRTLLEDPGLRSQLVERGRRRVSAFTLSGYGAGIAHALRQTTGN